MSRHGHASGGKVSPEYVSWREMHRRCGNPNCNRFHRYGGRGISVCAEWTGHGGFERFLADLGPRPEGTSLDREKLDEDYRPGNCRWATSSEQNKNRSTTRHINYMGRTQMLSEWAVELGIERRTLGARINQLGWSIDRAFTTPVRTNK